MLTLSSDKAAKVPDVGTYLGNIQAAGGSNTIAGFVVYDLPNRDCAASASNGEYSVADDGVTKYKAYIDSIKTQINKYSNVPVALVIEPDSLGNLITNSNVPNCSAAADAYKTCIQYALSTLDLPNVSQYLDAGHAGWLGWPANIGPAAQLFGQVYKAAGSPKSVRGLATNVANYNAFSIATCPSYTQGSKTCDEKTYINNLAPLLQQNGYPAHFIVDTCELPCSPLQARFSCPSLPLFPVLTKLSPHTPSSAQRQAAHGPAAVGRLVQHQGHRFRHALHH